jgi:hypothetical protein
MTIFLSGRRKKEEDCVIENICVELIEIIHNLFTYEPGQNTFCDILGKGLRLS